MSPDRCKLILGSAFLMVGVLFGALCFWLAWHAFGAREKDWALCAYVLIVLDAVFFFLPGVSILFHARTRHMHEMEPRTEHPASASDQAAASPPLYDLDIESERAWETLTLDVILDDAPRKGNALSHDCDQPMNGKNMTCYSRNRDREAGFRRAASC